MEQYLVRISKERLVFSAAHFITLRGGVCESLHGHNYQVAAEVQGPLDENHCVIDFAVLHDTLQAILDDLDHRVLLPTEHPSIRVAADDKEVCVTFQQRRWVFPRSDCRLLPIPNTTAELLARLIGQRLLDDLATRTGTRPSLARIEVAECPGQSAVCQLQG